MNRIDFLKSGTLLGAATLLSTTNAFAQNLTNNDIDKLVDANGNYIFPNLAPGTNYSVAFTTPAGYTPATANVGAVAAFGG